MPKYRYLFLLVLAILVPSLATVGLVQDKAVDIHAAWALALIGDTFWSTQWQWPPVSQLALYAVGVAIAAWLYRLLLCPLKISRTLHDVGYNKLAGYSRRDVANDVRRRRRRGELPPVYPNGWFRVMDSCQLQPNQVEGVTVLGEKLAVFRSAGGSVSVLDAYCPHLGADLAVGGQVVGDCLQCPFHGWKFRGEDGKCMGIPYAEKVPDFARVKSWPCLERNGCIYIWYHCDGVEPTWTPPIIDEIASGDWTCRGTTEHIINAHIEEVPENAADIAHLNYLHGPLVTAGVDLTSIYSSSWDFAKHVWRAEWQPDPAPDAHVSTMHTQHMVYLFGQKISIADIKATARQVGPGIVYLFLESGFGNFMLVQSITPVEPLLQRLTHSVYAGRWVPTCLAKFILWGEAVQVERDIMIWNNKCYVPRPLLVREDSSISRHRRWYSQFYSENSPRFKFERDSLDW
ncbi:cholesterol 7-desaturase nvd-like [Branchiostoma lanceolatum]|uniref:cholesterol 7-desaturase nvd-like n=1 Tax=Branchiostoma lanceolatum TaxID=7740 RepID=UPI0034568ADD